MGGDGSGKHEIRYTNGTVVGNYTYINDLGVRETRWYSAGPRGTEIAGDSVISPAPPTLIDETTGKNYVDLSNYDLYRHLEVPYIHISGPSDPDEKGQLSNPENERLGQQSFRGSLQSQGGRQQEVSQLPIDFGDDTHFISQQSGSSPIDESFAPEPIRTSSRQRPDRVARLRTPIQASEGQFNPSAVDNRSPNHVLDSLINQFQ